MLKAVTRQATAVDQKISLLNASHPAHPVSTAYFFDHHATPDDVAVTVTEQDFLDARDELVPSVSAGELAHYEKVRATFEGGRGEGTEKGKGRMVGARTVSSSSGKGKGKMVDGKGKGKALGGSEEEDEVSDVDEGAGYGNGGRAKGKGKAVFRDGTGSDDEGLYD